MLSVFVKNHHSKCVAAAETGIKLQFPGYGMSILEPKKKLALLIVGGYSYYTAVNTVVLYCRQMYGICILQVEVLWLKYSLKKKE